MSQNEIISASHSSSNASIIDPELKIILSSQQLVPKISSTNENAEKINLEPRTAIINLYTAHAKQNSQIATQLQNQKTIQNTNIQITEKQTNLHQNQQFTQYQANLKQNAQIETNQIQNKTETVRNTVKIPLKSKYALDELSELKWKIMKLKAENSELRFGNDEITEASKELLKDFHKATKEVKELRQYLENSLKNQTELSETVKQLTEELKKIKEEKAKVKKLPTQKSAKECVQCVNLETKKEKLVGEKGALQRKLEIKSQSQKFENDKGELRVFGHEENKRRAGRFISAYASARAQLTPSKIKLQLNKSKRSMGRSRRRGRVYIATSRTPSKNREETNLEMVVLEKSKQLKSSSKSSLELDAKVTKTIIKNESSMNEDSKIKTKKVESGTEFIIENLKGIYDEIDKSEDQNLESAKKSISHFVKTEDSSKSVYEDKSIDELEIKATHQKIITHVGSLVLRPKNILDSKEEEKKSVIEKVTPIDDHKIEIKRKGGTSKGKLELQFRNISQTLKKTQNFTNFLKEDDDASFADETENFDFSEISNMKEAEENDEELKDVYFAKKSFVSTMLGLIDSKSSSVVLDPEVKERLEKKKKEDQSNSNKLKTKSKTLNSSVNSQPHLDSK